MNIQRKKIIFIFVSVILFCYSCRKEKTIDTTPAPDTGHIVFKFIHNVDGLPLQKDTMIYINAAGNPYEIDQLMYFISDVTLHKSDGTEKIIDDWKDINYIDMDIPSTLTWDVYDHIPAGSYDSISFVFGITTAKNHSFMFVNPPEVFMAWPDVLGGGYHYMMINGKWRDTAGLIQNYNFHLGIGQLYKSDVINVDSIYAFVPNYFNVKLSNSYFTIEKDKTLQIEIIMNVDSWFKTPHIYDHNFWGGDIMQKQPAMQMAKENGFDVFSISNIH